MSLRCAGACLRLDGRPLLDDADIAFAPGRLTAILGPNGAGKSTLLAVLGGQRRLDAGQVLLDELALSAQTPAAVALRRALMPQESAVAFDFTVREIVDLGRFPHRRVPSPNESDIVDAAIALADVAMLAGRVLNSLSGGEKARAQLARALAQLWEPRPDGAARWLLLDEPTAALDLSHQHGAMRLLRDWAGQGVGVVAVLHDLNLARRYADDVVVLDGAAGVHQGPAAEILVPALIERVWAMPCQTVAATDGTVQYLFG